MNISLPPLPLSKYRPDIDGLRAIAVLSVVGFHAFPNFIKGGFIGVDLFFVISGFLISSLLFVSLENNTFSFFDFYQRRIKRIFPSLIITLFFCSILGWFTLYPEEYRQLGKHIVDGASFISNFTLWKEAGYFDNAADTKPLLHLWSLGIEEQFYLTWPLLLWAAWKKKCNFFWLALTLVLASFILNVFFINTRAVATFYSPQTRFWELLSGGLLAWFFSSSSSSQSSLSSSQSSLSSSQSSLSSSRASLSSSRAQRGISHGNLRYRNHLINNLYSFFGLLLIAYGVITFTKAAAFPGLLAVVPVLGAILIILAGPDTWFNRVLLSNRVMIWFGLISFPLYLWHWPLLSFARIMEGDIPPLITRVIIVFISVFLAWLTYRFIEKPIRFGKGTNTIKLLILIVLMITVGGVGRYVKKHDGISARFKNKAELIAFHQIAASPKTVFLNCTNLLPFFKEFQFDCVISKNKMPDTLFIGDSHTGHYRIAIGEQFQQNSVLSIVQSACFPFSSSYFLKDDCKKSYDSILSFLETNSSIKKVYLSGYWSYLMAGGFSKSGTNWRNARPVDEEGRKSFLKNGKEFLTRVLKSNKEIIFLKDIPDLDFNIHYCFVKRPLTLPYHKHSIKKCSIDFISYQKRTREYDAVINQLLAGFPQIKVYDPMLLFCKDNRCIARDGRSSYYVNGDHLSSYGADMVIKDMKQQLA